MIGKSACADANRCRLAKRALQPVPPQVRSRPLLENVKRTPWVSHEQIVPPPRLAGRSKADPAIGWRQHHQRRCRHLLHSRSPVDSAPAGPRHVNSNELGYCVRGETLVTIFSNQSERVSFIAARCSSCLQAISTTSRTPDLPRRCVPTARKGRREAVRRLNST
jgi:hypothetical protein